MSEIAREATNGNTHLREVIHLEHDNELYAHGERPALSDGSEDGSLLYREDGAVKIWRDVAPGALLELRYRVSTDAAANPRPFVHYEVEGVWCEEPLEKDGEEVSR